MDSFLKIIASASLATVSMAAVYFFLATVPKQIALENCLKSYGETEIKKVATEFSIDIVELCHKGNTFNKFRSLIEATTLEVVTEYKVQYANPGDPWIKEK